MSAEICSGVLPATWIVPASGIAKLPAPSTRPVLSRSVAPNTETVSSSPGTTWYGAVSIGITVESGAGSDCATFTAPESVPRPVPPAQPHSRIEAVIGSASFTIIPFQRFNERCPNSQPLRHNMVNGTLISVESTGRRTARPPDFQTPAPRTRRQRPGNPSGHGTQAPGGRNPGYQADRRHCWQEHVKIRHT